MNTTANTTNAVRNILAALTLSLLLATGTAWADDKAMPTKEGARKHTTMILEDGSRQEISYEWIDGDGDCIGVC